MGHELPRPLWDDIVGRISENAQIIARRRPNGEFVPTEELAGREGAKPN
jgi:hypothetical protein